MAAFLPTRGVVLSPMGYLSSNQRSLCTDWRDGDLRGELLTSLRSCSEMATSDTLTSITALPHLLFGDNGGCVYQGLGHLFLALMPPPPIGATAAALLRAPHDPCLLGG